jgi:hypothetical protein
VRCGKPRPVVFDTRRVGRLASIADAANLC